MTNPLAVFRCDASPTIGAGHVTRCLALAEALVIAGFEPVFAVRGATCDTVPALKRASVAVVDLTGPIEAEATELADRIGGACQVLVVDHYDRDISFEGAARRYAECILVLEDQTGRLHNCDIVVDASAKDPTAYRELMPASTRVLIGPQFALVRECFINMRELALASRNGGPVENVLVSFGATDPLNLASVALEALSHSGVVLTVALSSQAPHLNAICQKQDGKLVVVVDPAEMPRLMARADLAVGAGGGSAFERAALGLPAILVQTADNQRAVMDLLINAAAAWDAGKFDRKLAARLAYLFDRLAQDGAARSMMARAASDLIDGRGAMRVAEVLTRTARA